MRISTVMCCLFSLACAPLCAAPTLEQIMADPDWIGPPVEQAWLGLDDRHAYYRIKKAGSPLRELRRIDLASGGDVAVSDEMLADADAGNPVFDRERRRALFVRSGDLFLRDLTNGRGASRRSPIHASGPMAGFLSGRVTAG
jgi:hypothetical protein